MEEWDGLPWWQARLYVEQFNEEREGQNGQTPRDPDAPKLDELM